MKRHTESIMQSTTSNQHYVSANSSIFSWHNLLNNSSRMSSATARRKFIASMRRDEERMLIAKRDNEYLNKKIFNFGKNG